MDAEDFKIEAYGVVTPPPDDVLPEPDAPRRAPPDEDEDD